MNESDFKFLGYRISKIQVDINDSFGTDSEKISQKINIENNFSKENPGLVEVALNISVSSDTGNLEIFLRIKGGFLAGENLEKEKFQLLARQNGPAILFPFARAIITSYTAQANIPPVLLPTVNFSVDEVKE